VGLEERAARLRSLTVAAQADLARLQGAGSLQVQAAADARAEASQLEKGLARLKSSECPTCGQDIPEKLRQGYRDDIEGAQKRAQVAEQTFERAQREVEAQIADLSIELHDLNEQTNALAVERKTRDERARAARREMEEQEHLAGTHKAIGLQIKQCEEGIAEVTQAVEAVQVSLAAARKALDELQAVESVLGLKGVRAHVLGKALGGLERVANAWLSRIAGPDLRLKLCPYSEKKTGGISDSISLDVAGAGEGFGYKASSGGERRRIDVALLLALAEVAQAAHGLTPGTLFADECFDALDVDGAYRVAEVLREIARDRAVVVISHSDTLQQVLRPALHYYVDGGTVSVR
jgi:DNA repair exonuclease SbcCD ATPase subunit